MAPRGMRALSALAVALFGVDGARVKRDRVNVAKGTKFIAGVPVLNYHQAYGGKANLAQSNWKQDWVVVVEKGVTDEQVDAMCKMAECVREGHPSKGGVPFFEVRGTEADLEKVLVSAPGSIKFAEPDAQVTLIPDVLVETQASSWGLDRVGRSGRPNQGAGAHVYVLDTGIRATHNDYGGRVIPTLDMTTGSAVECKGSISCASDAQGHGSHCAGTAAGNSYGIASSATIHAVKVLSDSGSGSWSWSYDALDFLATKGQFPAVASMSLGGMGTQSAMAVAVDAAVDAGVVVVVAGGNSNMNACGFSPAFVPSAITVGSTTSTDSRSSFSNYGACTDIWAPGSDITSCGISSDGDSQTYSGTSMACPHVAGGAALVLAASPSLKPAGVLAALLDSGERGAITDLKSGDSNVMLWVSSAAAPVPVPTPEPTPVPTPVPTTPAPTPVPECPSWCSGYFRCAFAACAPCPQCRS